MTNIRTFVGERKPCKDQYIESKLLLCDKDFWNDVSKLDQRVTSIIREQLNNAQAKLLFQYSQSILMVKLSQMIHHQRRNLFI